jgi:hypothetical protein
LVTASALIDEKSPIEPSAPQSSGTRIRRIK